MRTVVVPHSDDCAGTNDQYLLNVWEADFAVININCADSVVYGLPCVPEIVGAKYAVRISSCIQSILINCNCINAVIQLGWILGVTVISGDVQSTLRSDSRRGVEAEPISLKYAHTIRGLPDSELSPLGADIRIRFVR